MTEKQNINLHRDSVKFLIIALFVLALFAALASLGIWYWQEREINRLNDRISQLEVEKSTEADRLNDRIMQLENQISATVARPPESTVPEQPQIKKFTSVKGVTIEVDLPAENSKVGSPLKVSGRVPGTWSFEASFPVLLKDGAGNILARGPARLEGAWMTGELVPFEANLSFTPPPAGQGSLVLQKSNPSGMPDKDDSLAIPVKF